MSQHLSLFQRYKRLLRAKKRGRWRYPPEVCGVIYTVGTPVIGCCLGFGLVRGLDQLGVFRSMWTLGLLLVFAVVLSSIVVTGHLIYLMLRRSAIDEGRCRTCDYDLTGNVSGICPECGTEVRA